jgi:hypothetical protein
MLGGRETQVRILSDPITGGNSEVARELSRNHPAVTFNGD